MANKLEYNIFISSPGDVGLEREIARRVIERSNGRLGGRINIQAYLWEHEPMLASRGDFQQNIREPAEFDLVLCILWSRLGSRLHPGKHQRSDGSQYASGTEYEFESAMAAAKAKGNPDLLIYRRNGRPEVEIEPESLYQERLDQWRSLNGFCERWFKDPETGTFAAAFNQYNDLAAFERSFEETLKKLVEARLLAAGETHTTSSVRERWWSGSPYRGLLAFEMEHEPIFYGRTRAKDEVIGALRARAMEEKLPFVLIYGASGAGKSSLMRAGVMPLLIKPGVIEGVDLWRHFWVRPATASKEEDLCAVLTRSLAGALPEILGADRDIAVLSARVREQPENLATYVELGLEKAADQAKREQEWPRLPVMRLAMGLDQMEEIFTLTQKFGDEDRQKFFRAVAGLVKSGRVFAVATLRSDFYAKCEGIPALMELQQGRGSYRLGVPDPVELAQMISYPAEAAGVEFEEHPEKGRLEVRILREAEGEPGALPLIEFALEQLYKRGSSDGLLTHAEYEEIGGVHKAVARTAEEAFESLRDFEKESLGKVLRGLVSLSEEDGLVPVRQTALREELTQQAGAEALIDRFVESRLLVSDRQHDGRVTITLAHEKLLEVWPEVKRRLNADIDFYQMRQRLRRSMRQWKEQKETSDYLLAVGRPLAEGRELLKLHGSDLTADEPRYIGESITAAEAAEKRRKKIRQRVMAGLSLLTLFAILGGTAAIRARAAALILPFFLAGLGTLAAFVAA